MFINIKNTFLAGMALLAFTACSNDESPTPEPTANTAKTIKLKGSIGEQSRSSQDLQNTRFKVNTLVDVQISSTNGGTIYAPMQYKVSNTQGALVPSNGTYPYYPIDGAGIKVRAIYPVGYMNETSFSVEGTQTDDNSYMKSDLMFATAEAANAQTDALNLQFYHKLTKILVNLTPEGNVDLEGAQVKLLGLYTTIGFNPNTGELGEVQGSRSDILIQTGGSGSTVECAAVIVPQTFTGGYLIEIRLRNNDILNYRSMQSIPFKSNTKYTYNITVTESNIKVASEVQPWIDTEDTDGRPRL